MQVATRLQNEKYFRDHPEIPVMISSFVRYIVSHDIMRSDPLHYWLINCYREVLLRRPAKIREFASGEGVYIIIYCTHTHTHTLATEYFTDPKLPEIVKVKCEET